MAPQRRALPRGPDSAGPGPGLGPGRGGRRHSSARKGRFQQDPRGRWLKAAILLLLSAAAGGGLVVWSRLRAEGGIPEGGTPGDGVTEVLAHRSDNLRDKFVEIPCSEDYDRHKRFEGCTPRKCGRGVTDAVITREEAERIRRIAERGLSLGGSDGGASILDLHSGALSLGKHFVNLYRYFGDKVQDIFTEEDFALYRDVRQRIQQRIAQVFGISSSAMYLTKPTFFSRMNSTGAKTTHDEYWHPHVDKAGCRFSPLDQRTSTGWRRFSGALALPSPSPSPATRSTASGTQSWGDSSGHGTGAQMKERSPARGEEKGRDHLL
ncbi:2-oxoglutarate and iron-dependent oxygenase domain-containing protein 3 isoform X2 [Aphelocoma coerulescens]|uniref:2-oxoglutarate and iron-dependent oxygenase domain-containing protein 3 isoform X2 n=1 Tax=Aphelocoma coerulescens TaxID=39617 RepID=UPI0036046E7F